MAKIAILISTKSVLAQYIDTAFLNSSMVEMASPPHDGAPKPRPVLSTRRSSRGGVAMSLETRPPRELLAQIGISGKEVVKIIRDRSWDIVEPHGLQQQKLYYLPGAKEKAKRGHETRQNEDFFVGEGELYAFILQQGGLRFLVPDEESSESDVETTQPTRQQEEEAVETSVEAEDESDDDVKDELLADQRKWKRRKKLSTAKRTPADKMPAAKRRQKSGKKSVATATATEEEEEQDRIRVSPRLKLEQATHAGIGQQTEFIEYQNSLRARGWRAQLLKDVDVHLLRATAAVDRRQREREASTDGKKKQARPAEGVGPHVADAAEILQELDGLMCSIRASQDDLSSMIELIIARGERWAIPDRIDPVGRIGIPGFVSTDAGSLVLMRDIERYLLLFVAAVRRYRRTRNAFCANEPASGSSQISEKRAELRALQLGIEESKRELVELAAIVAADASKSCQDTTPSTPPSTSQATVQGTGTSQSTSRTVRADASDT